MAVLSDLSGHGLVRGFDEYLTGYPLAELGAYALAKTWYAPEMPRPGCVWTHTLLIPFAKLGSVQSLQRFVRLFVRPMVDEYGEFRNPRHATIDGEHLDDDVWAEHTVTNSGDVLRKLYESPNEAILVPISSATLAENVFLEIWSQQWPRLRRSFTFCTGSISGRRMDGRWFDLQGVPEKRVDDVVRTTSNSVVAKLQVQLSTMEVGGWWRAAINDLSGSTNVLRKFLFEFGAEAGGGRRDFVPLTKLYLAVNGEANDSIEDLVRSLNVLFPKPSMGVKFKGRLLAGEVGTEVMRKPDIPLRIILHAGENLFGIDEQQLKHIVQVAWEYNAGRIVEAIDVLIGQNRTVAGPILAVLADILEPDELATTSVCADALMTLAAHRPVILAHESFRGIVERNGMLLEYLASARAEPEDILTILGQWFREGAFECFEEASRGSPSTVIPRILDLVSDTAPEVESEFPTDLLIRLCKRSQDHAVKWLKNNIIGVRSGKTAVKVVACIVVAIEYTTIRITKGNVDDWEILIENQMKLDAVLRKTVVMRLFLQAMRVKGSSGAQIATAAFPHIYWRLMRSEMSYSEWYTLQEEAVGFSSDWDRCRRLTEGLIDKFWEFGWPKKHFGKMLSNNDELGFRLENTRFYRSRYRKFVSRSLK